jgi:NAD(P)H-hydrate epimerase
MATAGSGDVLCGIAGALLAKGLSPLIGMSLASYIHAKAGDFAKSVFGEESLISSDIIASLPHVFDPSLLDSWE